MQVKSTLASTWWEKGGKGEREKRTSPTHPFPLSPFRKSNSAVVEHAKLAPDAAEGVEDEVQVIVGMGRHVGGAHQSVTVGHRAARITRNLV